MIIANDVESIMQTFLGELLKTGDVVLSKKYHKDESCPLCLQPKSIDELRLEIAERLKEIEESTKKKVSFDKAKQLIQSITVERTKRLDTIFSEALIESEDNKYIKTGFEDLKKKVNEFQKSSVEKVTSGNKIPKIDTIKLELIDFDNS